ncbi:MAG: alpha/beta hydrolase [Pseudomonadota bacterium]
MSTPSRFADNNGIRIHYTVQGEGPLVVAVHGFPDFHGSWDDILPHLSDGYRVAAMDLRGYNLSDQPDEVEAYDIRTLCQDVIAVMRAESEDSAILMGHDLGAALAWQLAIHSPELVRQLVIFSVPHPVLFRQEIGANQDQKDRSDYARKFQLEGSEERLSVDKILGIMKIRDKAKEAKYREAFERSSFRGMMNMYRTSFPKGTSPRPADPSAFPKVKAPTLIVHGVDDVALVASGHNNSWEYVEKDLTLMMIPGAGHWVHHDEADLVGRSVRNWLDLRAR